MFVVWIVFCRRTHAHRILSCLVIGGPMDLDLVFVIVVVVCAAAVDADVCFICYVHEQQSLASSADVRQMAKLCCCYSCLCYCSCPCSCAHSLHALPHSLTN